ncbi:MAG: hypothetical protein DWQ02_24780 [Bacteroidetes bacterium]|nr:MAG: hypothetical protein DWQ02_24780 [Bacteroidota bacterium]
MTYAICPVSTAPVRNTSSHKSEMISQLLFGELVEVLELKGRQWVKVRCCDDNFVGWVSSNQLEIITPSEYEIYRDNFAFVFDFFHPAHANSHFMPLMVGCRLPNFDGIQFTIGENTFNFSGRAVYPQDAKRDPEILVKLAKMYLNVPFLWGGRSAMGIDAPGFVQVVCRMSGIQLPREAEEQIYSGDNVEFIDHALPGDLAYFENTRGRITHVGILLKDKQVIHAYGKVRIDDIDHFGIFNQELKRYTHKLRLIKRIFSPKQESKNDAAIKSVGEATQIELF